MKVLSKLLLSATAAVLCMGTLPALAQSLSVVSIPEALQGYYTLDVTGATPSSPLQNTDTQLGTDDLHFYLSPIGEICLKNPSSGNVEILSSQPKLQYGLFSKVSWDIESLAMRFTLDIAQSSFAGIDVASLSGTAYGRLTGTRQGADTGTCKSSSFDSRNALVVITGAEKTSPANFPPSALSVNQIGDGFDLYRYYPSTKVYLAVKGNTVLARGGDFGVEYVVVGYVDDLLSTPSNLRVPSSDSRLSFFAGTYLLEMTEALAVSPIADGTVLNLVVGDGGLLCVGEKVLAFPSITGTNATWTDKYSNIRYVLDLSRSSDSENFGVGEFSFQSSSGNAFGLLAGDQTSLSKECSGAQGTDSELSAKNAFFSLIEAEYPNVFPSGPQTFNQTQDGFTYRYYFDSQVFVGIKDSVVYVNGGEFGNNTNPVAMGSITALTAQISNVPTNHNIPRSKAGTYSVEFSGTSAIRAFNDGDTATVVLDTVGAMCFDGVSLGLPTTLKSNPNSTFWGNADLGLKLTMDTSTVLTDAISLTVSAFAGTSTVASLAGDRTSFETACGTDSQVINIAESQTLFNLAEQYFPQYFPKSTLSVDQLQGNTLIRFYQATGMGMKVDGQAVFVRGGPFGTPYVYVGDVAALTAQIVADNTPVVPTPVVPIYDLRVTGRGEIIVNAETIIRPSVDIKKYAVSKPDSSDNSALQAIVSSSLSDILPIIDSVSVSVVSETASTLVLSATVSRSSNLPGSSKESEYEVTLTFTQR